MLQLNFHIVVVQFRLRGQNALLSSRKSPFNTASAGSFAVGRGANLRGIWLRKLHTFIRVAMGRHRATRLTTLQVLSFGLLGEFGQEMLLNRLGVVQAGRQDLDWLRSTGFPCQDGVGPGEPTPPFRGWLADRHNM